MLTVNIHEAKTHLSRLLQKAAQGEPFIIAKAGRPLVKVIPYVQDDRPKRRLGFLAGQARIPDDFDSMGDDEIDPLFNR